MLKNKYHTDEVELKSKILKAGLGLTNNRTRFILAFTEKFRKNPKEYKKKATESWRGFANRLQNDILGLGTAKVRFAIELIYPNEAQLVCTDVHIMRWGKQKQTAPKSIHQKVEQGFINHAKQHGINPVEMRWKIWDKIQGYTDPRYWSWVLEK